MSISKTFSDFATHFAHATGRPLTFVLAFALILLWAATGPWFDYSETWQLVINTGTTIITFLMVFLIQNTQNLDGLIRASAARNRYIGIEHLTEEEVNELREKSEARAKAAKTKNKQRQK